MRQRRSELILYGYYVCLAMTVNLILAKLWNWGFSRRELALYLLLFCGCLWICRIFGKGVWIPVWTAVWGVWQADLFFIFPGCVRQFLSLQPVCAILWKLK